MLTTAKSVVPVLAIGFWMFAVVAQASEPYDYIDNVISSLQSSIIASERMKQSQTDSIVSHMKAIMTFDYGMQEAAQFIEPYVSSKNEIIQQSAENIHFVYSSVARNNEELLIYLKETMDNPSSENSKEGTIMMNISKNMALNEELWRMLMHSTLMSAYCLIDQERIVAGKLPYLTIKDSERKALNKKLISIFGENVKAGPKAGQIPIEASAASIYTVLNGKLKSADSK
jgi:hypothetical protein